MAQLPLVLVTGLPASGKTTLARRVAGDLCLPLISRDDIKETLFDSLGWSDRAWSRRVGMASWRLLYHLIEVQLVAGRSAIVESNFHPTDAFTSFARLQARYPFEPFQIHCIADSAVLLERYAERAYSGERHPGHVDHLILDEVRPILLHRPQQPLDLPGALITVDTTDVDAIDYDSLLAALRAVLDGR